MSGVLCEVETDMELPEVLREGKGNVSRRAKPGSRVLQSALRLANWLRRDPSAAEVRPERCLGCGLMHGVGTRITGNGRRKRSCKGPWELDGEPRAETVLGRRYECQVCKGCMFVVPLEITGRFRYTLRAMLLALAYWGLAGQPGGEVRERISPEEPRGFGDPRLWSSLRRWVRQRAELWPAVHVQSRATLRETARALVMALCARLSRAPPVPTPGDAWEAALCG